LTVAPPVIGPATVPGGYVGWAYSQKLTVADPATSYTFAITAGSLPDGLTLDSDGTLHGTPSATGTFAFTVTANGADGQVGVRAYTVAIAPAVVVNTAAVPDGTVGVAYSQTLKATGPATPFTFTVAGTLPPGLTLDSTTGVLSGTPTTTGTFTFTVSATGTNGLSESQAYTVSVLPVGNILTVTSLADDDSPGTLRYELGLVNADARSTADRIVFAVGGTVTLSGGQLELSRTTGPVVIDGGGMAVTIDGNGGGSVFRVDSGVTATLSGLTVTGGTNSGIVNFGTLTVAGVTVTGNSTTNEGGGIDDQGTLTVSHSTITGNWAAVSGGGINDNGTLTVTDSTIVGNTADHAGGGIALQYYLFIQAGGVDNNGGADPPMGIGYLRPRNLDIGGSIVSGNVRPDGSAGGEPNIDAVMGDWEDGYGLEHLAIYLADHGYNLFGTDVPATGTGDVSSDAPLLGPLADNGEPTQTMALLPNSPAIDAGNPTDKSPDQRGVVVQNGRRDIGAFEYAAPAPELIVGPATLPLAEVGAAYRQTLTASGPAGPFTFAVTDGSLPPGLTLSPAGILSGTPTAAGTFAFAVTATAADGAAGSRAVVLVVKPGATATTAAPAVAVYGDPEVTLTAEVTGPWGPANDGSVTFAVTDSAGNPVWAWGCPCRSWVDGRRPRSRSRPTPRRGRTPSPRCTPGPPTSPPALPRRPP
jgi:hypothetical protein